MVEAQTFSYHRMQHLLAQSMEDNLIAMKLAKKECKASEQLHADVWANCFSNKFVNEVILKLLEEALKHICTLEKNKWEVADYDVDLVNSYKCNIRDRIANIRDNYLEGKPSAFGPEDKLRILASKPE